MFIFGNETYQVIFLTFAYFQRPLHFITTEDTMNHKYTIS